MKNLFILIFVFVSSQIFAQISTTRMDDFRLNMTLPELEKTLGKKVELTKDENQYNYIYKTNHKGNDFEFLFYELTDENGRSYMNLFQISTTSSKIKTLSKVGVGNTLDELWNVYKNYTISIWNQWDEKTETYHKDNRVFQLYDNDNGNVLYFDIKNNKVVKISLGMNEGC